MQRKYNYNYYCCENPGHWKEVAISEASTENHTQFNPLLLLIKSCFIFNLSFLQTRGSIPLFWSQRPNLKYKPTPLLNSSADHVSDLSVKYKIKFESQTAVHLFPLVRYLLTPFLPAMFFCFKEKKVIYLAGLSWNSNSMFYPTSPIEFFLVIFSMIWVLYFVFIAENRILSPSRQRESVLWRTCVNKPGKVFY